jgi:hypothetical protein
MMPIAMGMGMGMGKPTRNELLAEYYLRAAGVAAVWIDAAGHVGAQDVASIGMRPDRLVYAAPAASISRSLTAFTNGRRVSNPSSTGRLRWINEGRLRPGLRRWPTAAVSD